MYYSTYSCPTVNPGYLTTTGDAQTNFFPFLGPFAVGLGLGLLPFAAAGAANAICRGPYCGGGCAGPYCGRGVPGPYYGGSPWGGWRGYGPGW